MQPPETRNPTTGARWSGKSQEALGRTWTNLPKAMAGRMVDHQVTRAQATGNRFADETPQQIAEHREIARRHRRRRNDAANFLRAFALPNWNVFSSCTTARGVCPTTTRAAPTFS